MLLSTAYFPPIEYIAAIADGMVLSPDRIVPSEVFIEACETYQKQSYRNRCYFYAGDGVQYLNVPIQHGDTGSRLITDIKVDYKTPWVIKDQRAISSAYESSAYFEYYRDELFAIMDSHPETLFDLNMKILQFFLDKTGISANIHFTEEFVQKGSSLYGPDYREVIHPKRPNSILEDLNLKKPYFQVFSQKYGFKSNLSIMDLLFNEGPDSIIYLKRL